MSPNNFAAVLPVAQGTITVGPVDYPTLPPGGVILRNTVVALNPVDWKIARNGNRPIQYPLYWATPTAGSSRPWMKPSGA